MNTKKPSDKDLEYELPEEQFGDEIGPEFQEQSQPLKKSFLKRLPKKKVIVGIFILVMAALVYQFLSRQEEKALQPVQPEVLQPVQTKAAKAAPPPVAAAVTPTVSAAEVQKQVESLMKEQQTSGQSQSQELQAQVQEVKQSVQGLQSSLLTLANSVEAVSTQVQTMKAQPQQAAVLPLQWVPKGAVVRKVYYLKSIAAGRENVRTSAGEIVSVKVDRAFLATPNGEFTSVKVGDQLRGYGCVSAISADQGWVSFSSGAVIKYGPTDS